MKVHPIIMQGISRYSDQVGILWNSLADYYIRDGLFEKVSYYYPYSYPYSYYYYPYSYSYYCSYYSYYPYPYCYS